ncbi:PREDICTED: fibronectin type III domain-containing protein 4 isoform X2 [Calidris pugnax]|uniref:fibronectin type III domain-containing protein 4 isoform X2 n=1 Tax=Calidris pugnax TaxID=198806 RepID=UPI00071C7A3B|nr:PREDICTED: fibronectin type III domain-containing protein 4 isoform X2 [Calidris pugnax]
MCTSWDERSLILPLQSWLKDYTNVGFVWTFWTLQKHWTSLPRAYSVPRLSRSMSCQAALLLLVLQLKEVNFPTDEHQSSSEDRPPSPVNVTVTQLKANSATVSWDVPEGDVVIGYAILQQRQDGQMQRFIREVNTTNRACVLWDLAEDADYIIQVQSIGLYGESQASKRVHFRTLKETDRLPSNSSNQGDITMEGLDKDRQLQTGEIIIIVAVLLMWAAVIALFCRQYDIIKDNDSNNNKEKTKPSSEHSTPERPSGGLLRSKKSPSVNIIEV